MQFDELKKLKSGTDVRGVAVEGGLPVNLTDEVVQLIVNAFVKWLSLKYGKTKFRIAIGNDSRISATRIVNAAKCALISSGCDVVYTGLSSTPSMFILLKKSGWGADASIMVTASHMPYDRNGLKFFTPEGGLDGKDLEEILRIAADGGKLHGEGSYEEKSFMDEYSSILVQTVESACGKLPLKGKKIIVDAGNGAGGFFAEKVLKPLGANTEGGQFLEPDGYFPNHIPNPEDKAAISSISSAVIKEKADLGIIFDTDVDRAACVDKNGGEINRNALIALVSAILLREKAGTIVTDSVTSDGLTEFIENLGGKHLRYKRGYKNVIDKCKELNEGGEYSPLAIETSGHAAFKENYYLDDGAYLITKILISLALQAKEGKDLTSLISALKRPAEECEVRIAFNDKSVDFKKEGASVIEDLKVIAENDENLILSPENHEGVRINFKEGGWVLVRMSVHDPVMPINFESNYKGGNIKAAKTLLKILEGYPFLELKNLKTVLYKEKPSMSINKKCIDTVRVLSAEAIQRAKSGHPGICLGAAPVGFEVFKDFLKFNSENPHWDNRDRFVLSAGHGSMLLYSLLHLFGYDLTKEDLMNFRQLGSRTPGHPEYGVTDGVETSTGPLGQGIGNAVGFALAEAHLAAVFNRPDFPIVDHFTYVLCGEGCLEEGISYEACSFAGTQKLGKLILLYDKNNITIEGDTSASFSEDIATRFCAQGWQVIRVPDANNLSVLKLAIQRAQSDLTRPSIIICTSKIGYGSPLEGSEKIHGAPMGEENLAKFKESLNWTEEPFEVPEDVKDYCSKIADEKRVYEQEWNELFANYQRAYPELAEKYKNYMNGYQLDYTELFSKFDFSSPEASRASGGKILNELAKNIPNLLSGSADLTPSTLTNLKCSGNFSPDNRTGRNILFGIREHAMAAISNGIQLHGGLRILCSTFFSFSDYMKGGIRMSGLLNVPVIYVLTHDSIGVGEDGPSHQPMEQLIAMRSVPNVKVFRPCDGKETLAAYISALAGQSPTVLVLSRQNLNQYENSGIKALTGGYILEDCKGEPDVLLIGTGSEVGICTGAKELLANEGIKARVVSMPSLEEFENQTEEYKESVLPKSVKARVCVEAASHYSWYKYCGDYGEIIAMHSFGASGKANELFEHYGFTKENVVEKAKLSLQKVHADEDDGKKKHK